MLNAMLNPTGPRLVLVEDDEEVRKSLTLMLRGRGFSLDVFDHAMQLLASGHIPKADCLLIDYKMPVIDGVTLLKKLNHSGLRAPALLLTGFFSNSLCQIATQAGFHGVIEKPTDADQLIADINMLVQG